MSTLNDTPGSNRLHIGIFGKTNSGKSSFMNALTGQQVSIVADKAGTTTDPVYKSMELSPLGACVMIDTAGFDDSSALGESRLSRTRLAAEKSDIAVILISAEEITNVEEDLKSTADIRKDLKSAADIRKDLKSTVSIEFAAESEIEKAAEAAQFIQGFPEEAKWHQFFKEKNTPVLFVVSKADICNGARVQHLAAQISRITGEEVIAVSAVAGTGMDKAKEALSRLMPESCGEHSITGDLVQEDELVLLVIPQDIQAPKGRLILPQVQTLRELLDKKCMVMSVTTDRFLQALAMLQKPPKLIITDSQVFRYVYENKPKESMLTSFSILFAAHKGDIAYYMKGAKTIDKLNAHSRILIAECCTHAPLQEDIGREKIPRMLKKRFGDMLRIDHVSGADYPEDLTVYDLVIQCGACMFNRKYVLSRIERAKAQHVPMTNYGILIAHLTGILEQVAVPFEKQFEKQNISLL